MRNSLGYICVSGKKLQMSPSPIKEAEWKVANTGFMCFSFENAAAGGFLKLSGSNIVIVSMQMYIILFNVQYVGRNNTHDKYFYIR